MAAISNVKSWTVNPSAELHAIGTSGTAGWKNRITGTRDWTASVVAAALGAGPTIAVGAAGTLVLYENGTLNWSGPAKLESVESEADRDSGAPILYTYNFGGNGAPTAPTGAGTTLLGAILAAADWTAA